MLDKIYDLMLDALILVGLEAIIVGQSHRCRELLALVMITAVFTVSLAALFPATGAMNFYADDAFKAMFSKDTGVSAIPQILEIRSSAPVIFNPLQLAGLAQFPSFHTVCGILIIYGSRGQILRHAIGIAFGITLISATPIFGSHYFVDLLAGLGVAAGFIWLGRKFGLHNESVEFRSN